MILSLSYLAVLLVSIGCIVLCDARWKLAFFADARRAALVIGIGMAFFIVWDILGIALGIFFEGDSPFVTNISLAPEFPVEELFFLVLLNYVTLCIWRLWERQCSPTQS